MNVTDPIADMLTRIRNGQVAKLETVDIPASKMKTSIANILLEEGYIKGYKLIPDNKQGMLKVTLKYASGNDKVIRGLRRISKPGLRVYVTKDKLPKVLGGLGVAIISTSKGVMTDRAAREANLGGEVLAYIW